MVFVKHSYGAYHKEIKQLMNRRLKLLDKVRYHKLKIVEQEELIKSMEIDIDKYFGYANHKF